MAKPGPDVIREQIAGRQPTIQGLAVLTILLHQQQICSKNTRTGCIVTPRFRQLERFPRHQQ
jgi:hypothetical protein